MKRTLLLWRLELKRTVKQLPSMLCFAVALLAVTVICAYAAGRLLYQDSPALEVTVAVVEEGESPLTELAINYVQGMESVSEICSFLTVTKEEGFTMLREGGAAALVILPGGMIEGILSGANQPVEIYFPDNAGIESALLKSFTDAGVQMLRVAQAQIYGIYDTARAYGTLEGLSVLYADVDRYNLAFALDRLALFKKQEVSATESLTVVQYASASGILFFLLLLGMACYPVMRPASIVLQRQLLRQGIGIGAQCFGRWLCGLCGMAAGCGMLLLLIKAAGAGAGLGQIGLWFFVLFCITTFAFMIFQLAGSAVAAMLILFLSSAVMLYLAGGLLPWAFLPEKVQELAAFVPVTYLLQAVRSLYAGRIQGRTIGVLILFCALFAAVSHGAAVFRVKKGTEA